MLLPIVRDNEHVAVIILSMHSDEGFISVSEAAKRGICLKTTRMRTSGRLLNPFALRRPFFCPPSLEAAGRVCPPDARTRRAGFLRPPDRAGTRSPPPCRRRQVEQGCGRRAGLSPYTVETHRTNLMQKLGLHSIAESWFTLFARGSLPRERQRLRRAHEEVPRQLPAKLPENRFCGPNSRVRT